MRTGIVLSYNKEVKYGFIKDLNGQKIRFYNEDEMDYCAGDIVQFKIGVMKNRPLAINVILIAKKVDRYSSDC